MFVAKQIDRKKVDRQSSMGFGERTGHKFGAEIV